MPYRIKVQNKMGDWYQIFPDDVMLKSFLKVMKEQGALFKRMEALLVKFMKYNL